MNTPSFSFEAIGTWWQIDVSGPCSEEELADVQQKIQDRIASFDLSYSRFQNDSLILQMAKKEGEYPLPSDGPPLLSFYRKLYDLTHENLLRVLVKRLKRQDMTKHTHLKKKNFPLLLHGKKHFRMTRRQICSI
jgi:hypothetical protein